jgi:hypothetical protein
MSWRKRFTFRDKRSIKHQVNGQEFRFYPNRMALLTEARDLAEPIAKAINTLFADQTRDASSNVKRHHEGDFFMEDIHTDAIDIEMAKHRVAERNEAIQTIMGTLADTRALMLLGKLFMDSLRDEFPYAKERDPREVDEFLYGDDDEDSEYQGLDAPVLMELFQGWMKANASTFGASGESLVGLVKAKIEGLQADSERASETPDPTSGEPSKTPSSPQLVTDSEPSTSTN